MADEPYFDSLERVFSDLKRDPCDPQGRPSRVMLGIFYAFIDGESS